MWKYILRLGVSVFAFLSIVSCSSTLHFQDAAPLGKGVGEVMGGFGAGYYPESIESRNYGFPFTASFRYGVGDRSDLGIRYSLADDVELNFKQNLVNSRLFLFSTGLNVGLDGVFSSDKHFHATLPMYIQLRFGGFSIYGIPAVNTGRFGSSVGLSGNVGVSIGRWDERFFIEGGVADFEGTGTAIKTLGVGFAHRF